MVPIKEGELSMRADKLIAAHQKFCGYLKERIGKQKITLVSRPSGAKINALGMNAKEGTVAGYLAEFTADQVWLLMKRNYYLNRWVDYFNDERELDAIRVLREILNHFPLRSQENKYLVDHNFLDLNLADAFFKGQNIFLNYHSVDYSFDRKRMFANLSDYIHSMAISSYLKQIDFWEKVNQSQIPKDRLPVNFLINSQGGIFGFKNPIDYAILFSSSIPHFQTINIGQCWSISNYIFSRGKGRAAFPDSQFMLHGFWDPESYSFDRSVSEACFKEIATCFALASNADLEQTKNGFSSRSLEAIGKNQEQRYLFYGEEASNLYNYVNNLLRSDGEFAALGTGLSPLEKDKYAITFLWNDGGEKEFPLFSDLLRRIIPEIA